MLLAWASVSRGGLQFCGEVGSPAGNSASVGAESNCGCLECGDQTQPQRDLSLFTLDENRVTTEWDP